MTLVAMAQNRVTMAFACHRTRDGRDELIARGAQQIACMRREGTTMLPIPAELREARRPLSSP